MDDKVLVIGCATIIALATMIFYPIADSATIITQIITGLFGVAIGKSMNNGG